MASAAATKPKDPSYFTLVTIPDFLRYWAQHAPDHPAFIFRAPSSDERAPASSSSSVLDDRKNQPDAVNSGAQKTPEAFTLLAPLFDARHVLSYGALYELAGRWAAVLHARGLGRGAMVVNALPNCPERVVAECGVLLAGATSVNGMCHLRDASDLIQTLRQARAAALLLNPDVMGVAWSALSSHFKMEADGKMTSDGLPDLKFVFIIRRRRDMQRDRLIQEHIDAGETNTNPNQSAESPCKTPSSEEMEAKIDQNVFDPTSDQACPCMGQLGPTLCQESCAICTPNKPSRKSCTCYTPNDPNYLDFLTNLRNNTSLECFHSDDISGDDLASVFTTSGTTGFSKLVPHTHKNLTVFSRTYHPPPTVEFTLAPLGWFGGYPGNLIVSGSTGVHLDAMQGHPKDMNAFIYNSIMQEKVKYGVIPFTNLEAVAELHSASGADGPLLEVVVLGSQPVCKDVVKLGLRIARRVLICYGSTETNLVSRTMLTSPDRYEDLLAGRVLPHVEVKILNEYGNVNPPACLDIPHIDAKCRHGSVKSSAERCLPDADGNARGGGKTVREMENVSGRLRPDQVRAHSCTDQVGTNSVRGEQADSVQNAEVPQHTEADTEREFCHLGERVIDFVARQLDEKGKDLESVASEIGQKVANFHVSEKTAATHEASGLAEKTGLDISQLGQPGTNPESRQGDSSRIAADSTDSLPVQGKNSDNSAVNTEIFNPGQILMKGPYLFKGYLNDPESTARVFTEDGYFCTGDVGWMDEQARLFVEGRGGDAIMRGSYVFYPGWLEARIRACPGVADVMIVGVPNSLLTQELCACVVIESPDVSVDDVKRFVDNDVIVHEDDPKCPRPRHYLIFDTFPSTAGTDKPLRQEVMRMAAQRVGAGFSADER